MPRQSVFNSLLNPQFSAAIKTRAGSGKTWLRQERFVEQPSLIVEVLSPLTEAYDRGMKFEHYCAIAALVHYLLLDQDRVHAQLYSRIGGVWQLTAASGQEGEIVLGLLGIRLGLAEPYRQVEFSTLS
jgi:Uma2 family endonuclease